MLKIKGKKPNSHHCPSVLLLLFLLLMVPFTSEAQTVRCGSDLVNAPVAKDRAKTDDLAPGYDVSQQRYHVIPVVVHVFHEGRSDSLSPALIKSQIEAFNDDFGRAGDFREVKVANGADTRIRFCLANRDPKGNKTNGITYTKVNDAVITFDTEMRIKNQVRWPTNQYMNIWVVRGIASGRPNQRVQGYAYLPPNAANTKKDGLVIDHRFFGKDNPRNNFYRDGKVGTHEVGHYLNLFHPWGPRVESGCREDDRVDDTPLCKGPFEKLNAPNPCKPEPRHECPRFDRMTSNYMEYSIDRCMKAFTAGQAKRMRKAIAENRSQLVSFTNMLATGCGLTYDTLNSRDTFNSSIYPQVNAYPNPASDQLFISTLAKSSKVLSAQLMTMQGQIVNRPAPFRFRAGRFTLDVSDLPQGIYILRVNFGNTVRQSEIVIQR